MHLFRRLLFYSLAWLSLLAPVSIHGADSLDLAAELSLPGVKLVAVEFYASWCEPCVAAIPAWKGLHEQYRQRGLRIVVVSAEDNGSCPGPSGWTPDRLVCDDTGAIRKALRVEKLPQAFLYSWQGSLLAERAGVEVVAAQVERWFREVQLRITVGEVEVRGDKLAIGSNPAWVRELAVAEITRHSKFDVVSLSAGPLGPNTKSGCPAEFPPECDLRIVLSGDLQGNRQLSLSLEKGGCVLAASQQTYTGTGLDEDADSLKAAVVQGISDLFSRLHPVRRPAVPSPQALQDRLALQEALSYAADIRIRALAYREDPFLGNGCYPASLAKLGWRPRTPPYYYDYAVSGDCRQCLVTATARSGELQPREVKVRCADAFIDIGEGWTHPAALAERLLKGPAGP